MIATSLKYQVLSRNTAYVGVIKQKDKPTGEMIKLQVNQQEKPEPKFYGGFGYAASRGGGAMMFGARGGRGGGAVRMRCAMAAPQMAKKSCAMPVS